MMETIRKAAVIGAGTMGAGIAAHLANAGLDVVLLDLDAKVAAAGLERQIKAGGLMHPSLAKNVVTGSSTTDLSLLADADWIIEAVAERLDIKRGLYAAIDGVRKPGAIVSSNTSTIPLGQLVETMPEDFARHFLVTHFFNPPRQMRLLELVTGPKTDPAVFARIGAFADAGLGKGVVVCKDTPGFIANRIGCFWLAAGQAEAIALCIDVEEADAVLGKPFGVPSTGIFGLLDLIGVDLVPYILRSLQGSLPENDPVQTFPAEPALVAAMIAAGRTGRKGGGGFYRLSADRKTRETIDLATGDYRPSRPVASESLDAARGDALALMAHAGVGGVYAARVMLKTLAYAARLVPEIADSPAAIDEAMRMGYAWKEGPFELIDRLGPAAIADELLAIGESVPPMLAFAIENGGFYRVRDGQVDCLTADGQYSPSAPREGVLTLAALARRTRPVWAGKEAQLWDLGDGVACLELRSKLNTFSPAVLEAVGEAVTVAERDFQALVIGSDAVAFSAGADLRTVLAMAEVGDIAAQRALVETGQRTFAAIKFSRIPVVGALAGLALGGGCEVLLHCDAVQAHAESQIGLVEPRVGLIPGWGGCKEMLLRFSRAPGAVRGPVAPALAAFGLIGATKTSTSAHDARALGFLRPSDGITMNRDRLLADAKARALELVPGYRPPEPQTLILSGASGASALRNGLDSEAAAGRLSPHDRVVGEALIDVLSGGPGADPVRPVSEETVLKLECEAFLALLGSKSTQARIRHMIDTGKPLRN